MTREVDRAARIVRSLLRLARRADVTPTRVQMNELIRDVVEIRHRVLRSESVEIRSEVDGAAPAVLGLGQELQQVVINLVTNAEHAVQGRTPAIIELTTEAREGWVRFIVEDSGPGIPLEIRHRIFDPFFTTKGPDEGTGLGLAICQRVVTRSGGRSGWKNPLWVVRALSSSCRPRLRVLNLQPSGNIPRGQISRICLR